MLGKLIRYELKSTSRVMWFIYAAVVASGALLGFVVPFGSRINTSTEIVNGEEVFSFGLGSGGTLVMILMIALFLIYVLLINAMAIMTTIMIIMRFYNNMLQGEGYLMHTLPVPAWQHVLCKLITAVLWQLIALVVAVLSGFLLSLTSGILPTILRQKEFGMLLDMAGEFLRENGVEFTSLAVLGTVSVISGILLYYFCMAIGNLANKNKLLLAVASYIGIQILLTVILPAAGVLSGVMQETGPNAAEPSASGIMLTVAAILAALGVIYFFGTTRILKKRLNLA